MEWSFIPFEQATTFGSTGTSLGAIRTEDGIVT